MHSERNDAEYGIDREKIPEDAYQLRSPQAPKRGDLQYFAKRQRGWCCYSDHLMGSLLAVDDSGVSFNSAEFASLGMYLHIFANCRNFRQLPFTGNPAKKRQLSLTAESYTDAGDRLQLQKEAPA